jgi:uncharacterized membrane protein
MWVISGSISIGATFSIVELIYKPIQYYIHERIWYKYIKFGLTEKLKQPIINEPKLEEQQIKRLTYSKKSN